MKISVKITRLENASFFHTQIGAIVEVDLEEYVAAVVASEISNSNLEACKAQAVAARTFAVKKGVLKGKIISDSSTTDQAYRASRYDEKLYFNCIQGANLTKGMILTYNGSPISAVYSDCNGGHTVSAASKWGGSYPYLIARKDPWDAATGKNANGHGVGMSQRGCVYAGNHNITYDKILEFYYPGTQLESILENKQQKLNRLKEILDILLQQSIT